MACIITNVCITETKREIEMGFKKVVKKVSKDSDSFKSEKSKVQNDSETKVNGSTVILKNVEVQFWSYRKISNNPMYEEKFAVTVKLSDKHVKQLEAAKEAAIQWFCSKKEPDLDPDSVEFTDSIYETKNGEMTYTFRSTKDFREITDLNGEQCDPELKIGRGSIVNLAVRASASKIFKSYNVTFYLNAANITSLEEFVGGQTDLRAALR